MNRMLRLFAIGCASILLYAPAAAQSVDPAADFPNRPVRIVVPFPAGGPTDILSRAVAQKLSEAWRQQVIIENRSGGNTAIGAQVVARAAPDGYTLFAAMDQTMVMNPAMGLQTPYDPLKDFAPITLASKNTTLLTVRADDGPKTVKELIARGKAAPKKLTYGAGIALTRLAGQAFARMAGFEVVLVPYRGSAEVVQGLLTGSVDFIVDGTASSMPHIKAGKFRPLAKLNNRPLPALPDLPPLAEAAGLPQLGEMSTWIGFVAPSGTPAPVIEKIRLEVARTFEDRTLVERLRTLGMNPETSTTAEFEAFYRAELVRWTQVFKESGIKLD